jgi:CheY-like chemotaxis protein
MKIFILEDNEYRLKFIKSFYKVSDTFIWEATVPNAIKAFKKNEPFDLILLDHDLGEEWDPNVGNGTDFAKFLAEHGTGKAQIVIHSMNRAGAERMKSYLPNTEILSIMNWKGYFTPIGEKLIQ